MAKDKFNYFDAFERIVGLACEEAKALREARTGEFAAISEPILGSSAD